MVRKIGYITLVIKDYDEAIAFYTKKMGFHLVEDIPITDEKRWILVTPENGLSPCLLLAKAATEEQANRIGNQTGGRVFLFLHTDNFWKDYREFRARGVLFTEAPRQEAYGMVAVFLDLYGNRWDLLEISRSK